MNEVQKTVLVPYERWFNEAPKVVEKSVQTDDQPQPESQRDAIKVGPPGIRSNKKKRRAKWITV